MIFISWSRERGMLILPNYFPLTWDMWKACLQTFKRNWIRSKLVYFLRNLQISRANNSRIRGIKDTHREKAPSNKTQAFTKSTHMGVWAVGTLNQWFIRGS